MKLSEKVVLVTGASKGIGRALAIGCAREGAQVVVNFGKDKTGADETIAQIKSLGHKAISWQADISLVPEIQAMFRQIVVEFGRVDVLINNAGITGWTPLFEITEQKWDQVIDTNLKVTFICSIEAARV